MSVRRPGSAIPGTDDPHGEDRSAATPIGSVGGPGIRRFVLALGIVAAFGIAVRHATALQFFCDDAYMPFRFAENLLSGHGIVFNPGERIEGYTNFLWILVLAGGMGCGLDPRTWALGAGALFLLVSFLLTIRFVRIATGSSGFAVLAMGLLASTGPLLLWSLSGMESAIFVATVLSAIGLQHRRAAPLRDTALSGVLHALSSMIRPDGAVFAAVGGLHLVAMGVLRRDAWPHLLRRAGGFLGGLLVVLGPFQWWRLHFYGDWLPNTYYVKTGSSIQWELGAKYWSAFARDYPVLWVGTWLGLWFALTRRGFRPHLPLLTHLGLAAIAYGIFVAKVGGDYMALYRFAVPVLPMMSIFTTLALQGVAELILGTAVGRWLAQGPGPRVLWGLAVAIGLCWWLHRPSFASLRGEDGEGLLRSQRDMKANTTRWVTVGKSLRDHLWPGARLSTTATGALAFHARAYTLDQSGLTDRYTAKVASDPWRLQVPGHMKQATRAHVLSQDPPIDLILGHPILHPGDPPVLLPDPPSSDYVCVRLPIEDRDTAPAGGFLYGYLHRDRLAVALERGFERFGPDLGE